MIQMQGVRKQYTTGAVTFEALSGVDLQIAKGEFVSIVGPSGSGKSTLMNIIGCLDIPTQGAYRLDGNNVADYNANQLADIRNQKVGFVFQAFNLLPYATAFENVEVPLLFAKVQAKERRRRVLELLERVGLGQKLSNKPTEMSGGEMQRVAIARALANNPEVILADEPTGNLDSRSGTEIMRMFHELHAQSKTIIVITHDMNLAKQTSRIIKIKDGMIDLNGNGSAVAA
jgi:putative ABC transport system ATP-binding protein